MTFGQYFSVLLLFCHSPNGYNHKYRSDTDQICYKTESQKGFRMNTTLKDKWSMNVPPEGKASQNKRRKRESLLNNAFELFTQKGITDTTISDIVEKAGVAKGTFYLYFQDYDVRTRGNIPFQVKYDEYIIKVIENIQNSIRKELHDRGIAIECAPTSNMLIGPFYRYDEHPMLNMCKIQRDENDLSVSINTDDAGIFCTSLYAEYSLMALALIKQGNINSVYDYIRRLKNNGNEQRFTHS